MPRTVLVSLTSAVVVAALSLTAAAHAEDKGKDKGKDKGAASGNFDDLFGPAPAKNNLDEMKKAADSVGTGKKSDGLAPKNDAAGGDASVVLLNVFAAEKITQDKKLGCQPAPGKKRVVEWSFDELPGKGQPFEVCLTLTSKAGREMSMSVAIVDGKNQRVATAQDVIDFRGRPKVDHVLEYPAPLFKSSGQHFYVVDLDGKEVGRLPLWVVKVQGEKTTETPRAPNLAAPAAAGDAPLAAQEPDHK